MLWYKTKQQWRVFESTWLKTQRTSSLMWYIRWAGAHQSSAPTCRVLPGPPAFCSVSLTAWRGKPGVQQGWLWCALPSPVTLYIPRPTQPCTSAVTESSTRFNWGEGGKVTAAEWQVTLCDPIWHVISCSREVISTNCYILFALLYETQYATTDMGFTSQSQRNWLLQIWV